MKNNATELIETEPGEKIRKYLVSHPFVRNVYYRPDTHRRSLGSEGLYATVERSISFDLEENTIEAGSILARSTYLFAPENYIDTSKSWICHPPSMILPGTPAYVRRRSRIRDSHILVRIGDEKIEDLINDLDQAISKVHKSVRN